MAETNHWAAEATSYRPSEDAPDFMALVYDPTPGGRKNDDGSTSFSMRFPALILTEYVSDPASVAAVLASKLNSNASQASRIEELEKALGMMLHAVCHETGFANAVRLDSGTAYPWPALDIAEEAARSALNGEQG